MLYTIIAYIVDGPSELAFGLTWKYQDRPLR
jgi:hypothetical protein